jgi:hypothetical protein
MCRRKEREKNEREEKKEIDCKLEKVTELVVWGYGARKEGEISGKKLEGERREDSHNDHVLFFLIYLSTIDHSSLSLFRLPYFLSSFVNRFTFFPLFFLSCYVFCFFSSATFIFFLSSPLCSLPFLFFPPHYLL